MEEARQVWRGEVVNGPDIAQVEISKSSDFLDVGLERCVRSVPVTRMAPRLLTRVDGETAQSSMIKGKLSVLDNVDLVPTRGLTSI